MLKYSWPGRRLTPIDLLGPLGASGNTFLTPRNRYLSVTTLKFAASANSTWCNFSPWAKHAPYNTAAATALGSFPDDIEFSLITDIADMSVFNHTKKASEILEYEKTLHKDLKVERWKELCMYNKRDFETMFTKDESYTLMEYRTDKVILIHWTSTRQQISNPLVFILLAETMVVI